MNQAAHTPLQPCAIRPWLFFLLLFLSSLILRAGQWPAWRGPEGTGIATEQNLPVHWSTNENVRWRAALPEPGNSTPVVWGRHVFITQAQGTRRLLMCFDRAVGKLLWQTEAETPTAEQTHESNPYSSSSPVTDGRLVIAWFGSAGLYCFDFNGKQLWHRDLGPQRHIWGWGSSPVLHGDLCFLNFGPGEPSFLLAVDKKSGRELWRIAEPNSDSGENKPGRDKPQWAGSWSTPILIRTTQREELILSWPKRILALDPQSGRELWNCAGINSLVYTSPLYDKESQVVVAMGGYMGMTVAVKAGGSGDVTETRQLWRHPKTRQRIGSGVIAHARIYILNDPGVAECFELATGQLVWEERLKGPAAKSDNWSSMVAVDEKLYVTNQGGDTFVLAPSTKCEVLATNSLQETTISSIAVSDGEIFLRTHKALWCIGEGKTSPKPASPRP
jgi:outer membrane protein assembly factor BamB